MKMHVLNKGKEKTILLIHPMLANSDCMRLCIADYMRQDVQFLMPNLNAHGDAMNMDYTSAKEEARMIYNYLIMNQIKTVELGYGASLGGVVLFELLKYPDIIFNHIFFEGVSFFTNAKAINLLLAKGFLKKQKKAMKKPDDLTKEMTKSYGEELAPVMVNQLIHASEETIRNIVHDCVFVDLPDLDKEIQEKCVFAYGDADPNLKEVKKVLPKKYPKAKLEIWKGYGHCERVARDSKAYAKMLQSIID